MTIWHELASPAGGAVLGLAGGLGLWVVVLRVPPARRPSLHERLSPYLREVAPPSRLLAHAGTSPPFVVVERLLGPWLSGATRTLERLSGGAASVRRRLDQLGGQGTVESFRAEQVLCGVAAMTASLLLALLLATREGVSVFPLVGLVLLGGVGGVLGRDQLLTRQVRVREERISEEFPTVAELLALSVSAGEGAVGALERVARTCGGELSGELRRTLAEAHAGAPLVTALEGLAARTNLVPLARFVDGVAVAVERGTPLAEVLRAQAQDVRDHGRRRLMETGGKKEIAMMIPVVFLVLPVTVLFAVFPGLAVLTVGL